MNGNCDNKGCGKTTELMLDVDTNEVVCQECGKPIKGIVETMKKMLKQQGKVIRSSIKKSFMMACRQCNANREVKLDRSTNKALCKVCGSEVSVHPIMLEAMKLTKEE